MLEIINRYYHETRNIDYIVLPKSAAGAIPAPSDAELKSYFESHRDLYRKPEYRKVSLLLVSSTSLAGIESAAHPISEAEIKKRYDEVKDQRYTQAEQRQIQQIHLPRTKRRPTRRPPNSPAARPSTRWLPNASWRRRIPTLATVTEATLADKSVATAVLRFAGRWCLQASEDAIRLGNPARREDHSEIVIPLVAVKTSLAQELAIFRAHKDLGKIHDQIEDQRAGGKSVADAAKAVGQSARTIDEIDAQGNNKASKAVPDLGDDQKAFLKAVFASDIGVDNDPITTKDGG